jgi:hypothetical protein
MKVETEELTTQDRVELFLMQVRGSMATAFIYANIRPTNDEMCLLYDMGDMTIRQMGEIAGRTGWNISLQLHEIPPNPPVPADRAPIAPGPTAGETPQP